MVRAWNIYLSETSGIIAGAIAEEVLNLHIYLENKGKRASLIGRTSERITLGKSLRDIRGGHGKVRLIEGESGIGKSRLVDLLQDFSKAYKVDCYQADDNVGDNNIPFQAWRNIQDGTSASCY